MSAADEINVRDPLLTADYLPRPRVYEIFDKAATSKLVYVIAGAGYGKTQAVHHYIEQQSDAVVRWVQLTESDNVGSRYWESLTHNVALDNPDLAVKLRELGFPETSARFKQFAGILKTTEHRSNKTFLVLDDFHLIHSSQALTFAERCAHLHIPGACVIIISRKEPEINAVSLFSKGLASTITENELRFTENEISDFLKKQDIPVSMKDLPLLADATKGWALALKLLSLVLKRMPKNLPLALDTMKQNIFKLMETEAWSDFPQSTQKTMIKLSLISDLPLTPLQDIIDDASLLQSTSRLSSFIWFDSFIGDYRVHPLYLEFLNSKQHILSYEETQDTYRWAALWCCNHNFQLDAMNYFAKSFQYDQMLDMLLSYPFNLPHDTCEYYLNILEKIDPDNKERSNLAVLLLKNLFIPLLNAGMGRYDEARERSYDVIREWENSDCQISPYLLYTVYSILAYIDTYTCTITHNYNFPGYLKKAADYYKKSSIPPTEVTGPFAVVNIRSYACLVGEGADLQEFDRFLEIVKETTQYIAESNHNMYYGYDDLVGCELAFFRNQLDLARNYAYSAIMKAREKKQCAIEFVAQFYLIRIAVHEGDGQLIKEILRQLRGHLDNPDFWNRQLLYDLITGSFFAYIGLNEKVPSWIAVDEKDTAAEVRIPVRELIVSVGYYLTAKKHKQALAILCNSYPREPQERFFFGELAFLVLQAYARLKTGDITGAVKDFENAYIMSFHGEFEMVFIELGKSFHQLATAAASHGDNVIPDAWIKTISRKASIYSKKADVIMNSIKREEQIKDKVPLSDREQDVLNDLYHGLSRDEIAANRYLSINTVKKILQTIYIKLDANNNVDAIRIAIDRKLVD